MKLTRRLKSSWATLLVIAVLVAIAAIQIQNQASYVSEAVARIAEGAGPTASVRNLTNVEQLQTQFNADQGRPRLILLFSPT